MKKSKFTEEQILYALKQGDAGRPVGDVCRQMGISEATFYVWKKRYTDMGILEVRELRQLRDENARLKRLVADLTLDRHVLQEVIKKRSEDRQATGDRTVDPRMLPDQHTALLHAELSAHCYPVLPVPGARQQRAEAASEGTCRYSSSIWARAAAYPAQAGRLAGRPQACSPSVQTRGTPAANESPSAQADQFAPRANSNRDVGRPILGDGFRP